MSTRQRPSKLLWLLASAVLLAAVGGVLHAAEPVPGPPPAGPPPAAPPVPVNLIANSDFEADADRDGVPDGWFHSDPQRWAGPAEGGESWKTLRELWAKTGAVPQVIPFRSPDTLEGGTYGWEASGHKGGHSISIDETGELKWGEWDTVVKDITPNTNYVILGWRRQSTPLGVKADAPPWLKVAAFGKMIPVRGTIDRDGWVPFAVPVNSGEFSGACNIGFIVEPATTKVWLDRVEMFAGTLADIPRFRVGLNGAELDYPFHGAAYASPDLECPFFLDILWSMHGATGDPGLEIAIDLPEGLDLTGGDGGTGVKLAEPAAQAITIEGRPYIRRTFQVVSARDRKEFDRAGQRPVRLWLKADPKLTSGTFEAFYHARWKQGRQADQPLAVQIIRFGKVKPPRGLLVGIDGFPRELVAARVDKLAKDLPALGLNALLVDAPVAPEVAEPLEKAGILPAAWFKLGSDPLPPEAVAQTAEQKPIPGAMCPTFRAADLLKTAFAQPAESVKAGITTLVTDLRGDFGRACFCPRCVKEFDAFLKQKAPQLKPVPPAEFEAAPEKFPEYHAAWTEFRAAKLADLYWTLRKQLDEMRRAADPPVRNSSLPLRLLAVVPGPRHEEKEPGAAGSAGYYAQLSGVLDAEIIEPELYRAGDSTTPACVGERVRRLAAILPPGGKTGVLVAAGSSEDRSAMAPVLHHADVRDQVLEAVIAGARTVILHPLYAVDGMHLAQFAEALALLSPFEDLIADGEPVSVVSVAEGPASARCLGKDPQFLILIRDYSQSPAAEAKLGLKLPVGDKRQPLVLLDVESASVIAEIQADGTSVTAPLGRRARLFYIGPRDRIPAALVEKAGKQARP